MASLQGLFLKFKVIQIIIRLKHCGVKTWTREKNPGAIFKVLKPWVGSYKSLFGVASLQDFFLKTKVIQIVIRLKHCTVKTWMREIKIPDLFLKSKIIPIVIRLKVGQKVFTLN